jgi:hypothetical protein
MRLWDEKWAWQAGHSPVVIVMVMVVTLIAILTITAFEPALGSDGLLSCPGHTPTDNEMVPHLACFICSLFFTYTYSLCFLLLSLFVCRFLLAISRGDV